MLLTVFVSILSLINVLDNSLVIVVILRGSMKTPMNYLMLNLAVADLTAGVFLAPSLLVEGFVPYPRGQIGDTLCRMFSGGNLAWLSLYSSVFSLVFIAFDRYFAIMRPLSLHHRITINKLKIFVPVCWVTSALLTIPVLYNGEFDERDMKCRRRWPPWLSKLYYSYCFIFMGILPIGIMAGLYSKVLYRLWFQNSDPNNATVHAVRRSRKSVTKTMLSISAIYVICCFPHLVEHILEEYFPNHFSFSTATSNIFHSVLLLNSTVNPLIYTFQCTQFRGRLRKIWCRRRKNSVRVAQWQSVEYTQKTGKCVAVVLARVFQSSILAQNLHAFFTP